MRISDWSSDVCSSDLEDEVLTSFLAQFYEEVPPPRRVLIGREPEELERRTEVRAERAGRRVAIRQPVRGPQRRLMDQARRNAQEALDRHLAETTTQGRILGELADLFELEAPPRRIEVYDNSHIQGTNALGAMIVAGPEGFIKNAYRKFNIKRAETTPRSEEHTSELQSLMRNSNAVICLKKQTTQKTTKQNQKERLQQHQ